MDHAEGRRGASRGGWRPPAPGCDRRPGAARRDLSERLRSLEVDGPLRRTVVPDTPVRVEHALTDKGADLAPSIETLATWAERWAEVETPTA